MGVKQRVNKSVLRKKHVMTIPRELVDQMHLEEGDEFIVTEERAHRPDPCAVHPGRPGVVLVVRLAGSRRRSGGRPAGWQQYGLPV